MTNAFVASPWTNLPDPVSSAPVDWAELRIDYPNLTVCRDQTGQANNEIIPVPNLHIRLAVTDDELLLDAIDADSKYYMLWRGNDDAGTQATALWFNTLRVFLLANGFSFAQTVDAIGLLPAARTKGVIAQSLNMWLKVNTS
jgi:hypothetical protein